MTLGVPGTPHEPTACRIDDGRLRPFLAELADPALEEAFQRHHLAQSLAQLRTALYICGVFYLAFFFTDVAALGWGWGALFLFCCRLVVMVAAFVVVHWARRHPWRVLATGYGATAIEILGMCTFLFIVALRPNEVAWHSISINLMLMVVYLFIPNRFVFALAVGLGATAAYVAAVIGLQQYTAVEATVMIMLLMLSNTFGAVAAHRYARVRREEYLAFVAEREANARLAQALAERTAAQQEAEQARQRAEYASGAKSQFLAHMSHEIRTPLHGIVGFLDLLDKTSLDSLQREYLHSSKLSARSLLAVINDILDFSKIEAGKLELESVRMNLRTQLEEAIAIHYGNAHAKCLGVYLLYHHLAPTQVRGDPVRVMQIVSNLVSNAVKFTDQGEVLVSVVQGGSDGLTAWMEISVKDSGIGMSDQQRENLFQPFVQGDASTTRRYGGTGLGLVICQHLVALMGGTLQVESRPGKGSEFRLRLPLPCEELAVTRPAPPGPVAIFTHNAFLAHELREMLLAWEIDAPWLASPQELRSWLEEGAQTACIIADQTMDEAEAHLHDLRRPCRLLWLCPPDMPSQWQQGLAENESWLVGLPRAEDVALWLEGGRPAHSAARESAKPERHRGRCLVVDDNDINRRLIVLLLDQYGLTPDEAQDGAEAVMLCREKRYDLIFMDIHMPAMDGMEATRLIRQAEQHGRHTPVVALTANAFPGDLERFRTAGMDDVLTKPMKEEQLVTILHRWLPDSPAPADRAEEEETMEQESLPVLDEAAGLSTAYGKRELWLKVLGMLVEGLPATLAQLDAAWQGQDWDEVYHVAHRLNGSAVYCGTPRLRAAAAALESAGRRREAEEIGRCLAHLKQEAGRLMEHDGLPIIRNGAE